MLSVIFSPDPHCVEKPYLPKPAPTHALHLRVNNLRFSRKPAAVVYAYTTADVSAAVRCASSSGVRVSVAGGRHAYEGLTQQDGYLTVDVSNFTEVST
jgi:FAD/FMN-containing dehydrogenase